MERSTNENLCFQPSVKVDFGKAQAKRTVSAMFCLITPVQNGVYSAMSDANQVTLSHTKFYMFVCVCEFINSGRTSKIL